MSPFSVTSRNLIFRTVSPANPSEQTAQLNNNFKYHYFFPYIVSVKQISAINFIGKQQFLYGHQISYVFIGWIIEKQLYCSPVFIIRIQNPGNYFFQQFQRKRIKKINPVHRFRNCIPLRICKCK